jgi:outer membrane protein
MKSNRYSVLVLTAALVIPALLGVVEAQTLKIGVFDPARVSEEAADAKRLQADLSAIRDAKQAEIGAQEATITELRQRIQQQALSLSADKRTSMEIDVQRKLLSLNTAKELASQQLQLEFSAAEVGFNDKLARVVDQYGRDNGFSLILDNSAVVFASATVDVTTPIIDLFNRLYPATASGEGQ